MTEECAFGDRLERLQKEMEEVRAEKAKFEAGLSKFFTDACFDNHWRSFDGLKDDGISCYRILKATSMDSGLIEKVWAIGDYVGITRSKSCFTDIQGEPMPLLEYSANRFTVLQKLGAFPPQGSQQ